MSKIWIKPQQVDITQDPGLSPPVVPKEDLGLGFVDANSTFTTSTPSTPLTNTVNNIYITRGPRGRDGQVQFNEDGSYTGDPGLLYEPNSDTLTTGTLDVNQLNANRANLGSINYLTILGGNNRDVLKTNGSGVITWASAFPSDVGNSGKFLMTNGISQQWAHPSYTNLVDVPSNIATQSYVGNAIANLVDSSPAALNTLNELATALGNNANYATDITNILANKANVTYVDNKLANITWANLTGRPTIPDAQINSDWTETNVASKAFIQNKPTLGNISNINISGSSSQVFYGNGIFASLPAEVNLGNLTFNGNNLSSTSNVVIITTSGTDGLTQLENKHINGDTYVWLDEGNVKIEADGNVWTFANSGNLMLPAGGDILDSTGNSVLGVSGANTGNITFSGNEIGSTGNFINITSTTGYVQLENLDSTNGSTYIYLQEGNVFVENNEGTWTFHNTGSLLFPETSNVEFAIVINDTLGEMSISTDSGNIAIWPENSKWLFGADGNLTLPANTFSVNYANGTQVSLGGGGNTDWANIGNINNASGPTEIAIGAYAGLTTQGTQAVAIGINAGVTTQGNNSVAIGPGAGANTQGTEAVAIGTGAGETTQGNSAVAIGQNAGLTNQGSYSVAIGYQAGQTDQIGDPSPSVAIGYQAGTNAQRGTAVAIGYQAGQTNQGYDTVAIGSGAGQTNQTQNAVAIGESAAGNTQGDAAVAVGNYAGNDSQGAGAVAVGVSAGENTQGTQSVAIGSNAGTTSQGENAVAIGSDAGQTNQAANTIILNATGVAVNGVASQTDSFYVAPIRSATATANVLYYDTTTKEVTYGAVAITDISVGAPNSASGGGGLSYANSTGVFTYTPPVIPDVSGFALTSDIPDVSGFVTGTPWTSEGYLTTITNIFDQALNTTNNVTFSSVITSNVQATNGSPARASPVAVGGAGAPLTIGAGDGGIAATGVNAGAGGNLTITAGDAGSDIGNPSWGEIGGTLVIRGGNSSRPYHGSDVQIHSGNAVTSPGAISLYTGTNQWTFGKTGDLTLPNGAVIRDTAGDAVAFGQDAGLTNQGLYAVAIGETAGNTSQGLYGVAVGQEAGSNIQGYGAVAVGSSAGYDTQGTQAVAIGIYAGYITQGANSVAVGQNAGHASQGINAVAIGYLAGNSSQGVYTVAIGNSAGQTSQGSESIAIGSTAGQTTQGAFSVAVGLNAGRTSQGGLAVALGYNAGLTSQGQEAVAIGYGAGQTSQGNNSIILNATGSALNQTTANTFTVKPVRQANTANAMYYDASTGEITYDTAGGGGNTGNVTFNDQAVVGTGDQVGSSGLYLAPGTESVGNLQYIRVRGGDVATHIHLDTGNNAYFDQYFGDDGKYVKLANTGNVVIGTDDANGNSAQWTFGTNGNLTLPSNLVIGTGAGSGSRIFQYDDGLEIVGEGANSVVLMGWTANISAPDSVATIAMNYPSGGEGNILIAVGNNATTVHSWLFGNDGNLTLPANTFAVNYANGTQVTLGDSYGNSDVATFLTSYGSNTIATTGNVSVGNLSTAGNITGNTNGFAIGYLNIPQVAAANATLALTDAGKHYYSTSAGNFTLTIPTNATVAFATGTAISIVVQSAGNVLVNAASGVTLYMAGNSTAANRVASTYAMATLMKVASDTWMINGTGVS